MSRSFNRKNWLINQLRRISLRYPPAINATNRTKETYYITSKKGKQLKRVKFTCECCGKKDLKRSEMNLDHKTPVQSSAGFIDWNSYIDGLFCDENNLWLICIECHQKKSLTEISDRVDFRRRVKKDIDNT